MYTCAMVSALLVCYDASSQENSLVVSDVISDHIIS